MSAPRIGDNALAALAAEIRQTHKAHRLMAEGAAFHALAMGRLLIEAKALVEHGEWGKWLHNNVGLSERSSRRYMQLANSGLEIGHVAEMGIRGAAESLARQQLLRAPPPGKELVFLGSGIAMAAPAHDDFWYMLVAGNSERVHLARPIAWEALPKAIEIASNARLTPETWRVETISAGFLAEVFEVIDAPLDVEQCLALAAMGDEAFEAYIAEQIGGMA